MNNIRFGPILAGLILGVAAGGSGMWWWQGRASQEVGAAPAEVCADGCGVSAHAGHAGEGEAGETCVALSDKAIAEAGIELATAAGGELERSLALPGEIVLNADHVAHIVPRVAGIVRRVDKLEGDNVQPGEIMALLESRELAEAKAAYLAAQQKLGLADANLKSAETLHQQKIMPDLEFLTIQKAQAEAGIDLSTAENKLHALGLSDVQLAELPANRHDLALYELRAPFAGTVIQKHCSLGEVLDSAADAFVLADLSTVWVNITVYAQDLRRVRVGHAVHLDVAGIDLQTDGTIGYVAPLLNETTRSVNARVELPNPERQWRPGLFVNATIVCDREQVPLLVPTDAVQRVKGAATVFVPDEDGFVPRPVTIGRANGAHVEIVAGLKAGEKYVTKGAFVLKSELGKGTGCQGH